MIRKDIHYYLKGVYAIYYKSRKTIYYNLDFEERECEKGRIIVVKD